MLTMELTPKIPCKWAKLLPSSLLAILVASAEERAGTRGIDRGAPACCKGAAQRRQLLAW